MPVLSGGFVMPGGTFFTGAATAPLDIVPASYPVAIAGRPYDIEPRLYRRSFVPIQRIGSDDDSEPGEKTLSAEALWRRSQSDWSLGAGQIWLDEEESVRRRFRSSLGLDVFNDREITLLPATEEKRNTASSAIKMLRVGSRLYVKDGNSLIFSNGTGSEQNATWVTGWTTATLPSGIIDLCFSGSHVYVLGTDNSIYRATPGTTLFALFYNPTAVATRIWAGLGRLFMSDGDQLWEVTATPGEVLLFTHPDPNFVIANLCGAPTGIYFVGATGDKGEVRHSWIKEDGTTFAAPVVAAEFLNEPVLCVAATGGVILIGTSLGYRFSRLDGLTTGLQFGPVVDIGPVNDIVFDSVDATTFAWFTWSAIEPGVSGLGRIRLNRFTEPEVPAYASDIHVVAGASALSCASIGGRRYVALAGDGFYGATANKVAEATLRTGRIRFGILDNKVFSDLSWRTAPLTGAITAEIEFDDGGTATAGAMTEQGTVTLNGAQIGPVFAEWGEITFTFLRDAVDPTLGPTFRWWLMRALPAPTGSIRFHVPVRLTEKIQPPRGPSRAVNFLGELDFLSALVNSRSTVKYQEGRASYDVYVNNLEMQPEQWNTMDHGLEGICLVEMISLH